MFDEAAAMRYKVRPKFVTLLAWLPSVACVLLPHYIMKVVLRAGIRLW